MKRKLGESFFANPPQLGYGPNMYGRKCWTLMVPHGDDSTVSLSIRHHYGNLEEYDENYVAELWLAGDCWQIVTREEWDKRRKDVILYDGEGAVDAWAETNRLYIGNDTLIEIVEELKKRWEAMVFTLKIFSPSVCL